MHEEQRAGVLPFLERLAVDRHLERVAAGRLALPDVGLDLAMRIRASSASRPRRSILRRIAICSSK